MPVGIAPSSFAFSFSTSSSTAAPAHLSPWLLGPRLYSLGGLTTTEPVSRTRPRVQAPSKQSFYSLCIAAFSIVLASPCHIPVVSIARRPCFVQRASGNAHFSPLTSHLPLSPSHASLFLPGLRRGLRTVFVRYHVPSSLLSLNRLNLHRA
jgi:hypothetical protein